MGSSSTSKLAAPDRATASIAVGNWLGFLASKTANGWPCAVAAVLISSRADAVKGVSGLPSTANSFFPGTRLIWLGRQDSNLGMAESKSAALPLGYAPLRWETGRTIPAGWVLST